MQHGQRVADKHGMNHDFAWFAPGILFPRLSDWNLELTVKCFWDS